MDWNFGVPFPFPGLASQLPPEFKWLTVVVVSISVKNLRNVTLCSIENGTFCFWNLLQWKMLIWLLNESYRPLSWSFPYLLHRGFLLHWRRYHHQFGKICMTGLGNCTGSLGRFCKEFDCFREYWDSGVTKSTVWWLFICNGKAGEVEKGRERWTYSLVVGFKRLMRIFRTRLFLVWALFSQRYVLHLQRIQSMRICHWENVRSEDQLHWGHPRGERRTMGHFPPKHGTSIGKIDKKSKVIEDQLQFQRVKKARGWRGKRPEILFLAEMFWKKDFSSWRRFIQTKKRSLEKT